MIGLLLPLWLNLGGGGGPAPDFVAADVFSYHYSSPEQSVFMSFEPFNEPLLVSTFVSTPEVSVFTGGDE